MKKVFILFVQVVVILSFFTSCCTIKKVKNKNVNSVLAAINKMDSVEKTNCYFLAIKVNIDIYVDDDFTNGHAILDIAKVNLNGDVIKALMTEFNLEFPPDIEILIRNGDQIITSYEGTCYSSIRRDIPPDYNEYMWSDTIE